MNIFEGITKEKFIEEFNKKKNGFLSILHINLAFDYQDLKKKYSYGLELRSITNVNNYEEEIDVFNSFKPFVEYDEKPVLIIENYNKYLSYRGKLENKLVGYRSINRSIKVTSISAEKLANNKLWKDDFDYIIFDDVKNFDKFVKVDEKRKTYDNIVSELSKTVEKYAEKYKLVFIERLIEFADLGYEVGISLSFTEFDHLKNSKKFTKKHLKENSFTDEFKLRIYGTFADAICKFKNPVLIDDYLKLLDEYLLTINDVGELIGYDIMMIDFLNFKFKKR